MQQQLQDKDFTKQFGQWAEQQACKYLQERGFRLLEQNFHSRFGEIDLIMQQGQLIVFVEVKARSNINYGRAVEMITKPKQQKMIQTALHFLQLNSQYQDFDCRFDAICIQITQQIAKTIQQDFSRLHYDLDWIESAFTLD